MADTLLLQLVSPERILAEEQVTEAQIPALEGYIGVLPGHAPLLSALKPGGVMSYTANGARRVLALYGGFVEVLPESVKVLADGAQFKEEINLADAQKKVQEATARMEKAATDLSADQDAVQADVLRAQAAVDAVSKS